MKVTEIDENGKEINQVIPTVVKSKTQIMGELQLQLTELQKTFAKARPNTAKTKNKAAADFYYKAKANIIIQCKTKLEVDNKTWTKNDKESIWPQKFIGEIEKIFKIDEKAANDQKISDLKNKIETLKKKIKDNAGTDELLQEITNLKTENEKLENEKEKWILDLQEKEEKEETEIKKEYEQKIKALKLENMDLKSRNDILATKNLPRIGQKVDDPRKQKEQIPSVNQNEKMLALLHSMTAKISELEQRTSPPSIIQEIARESSTFPNAVNEELFKIAETTDKTLPTATRIKRKITNLFGHQTLTCLGKRK